MDIYDKARDLANSILNSKEGKNFIELKYILDGDFESKEKLERFIQIKQKLRTNISKEELEKTQNDLTKVTEEIKKDKILKDYTIAEKEFSDYVNSVMDVFNATLLNELGDEEASTGCCGGGCSGCLGC